MQGGQAMLKTIQRIGTDYIFSSPGSEWPPIWEALAQQTAQGITRPGFINCRHEAVAVAMAAGYTKATGQAPGRVFTSKQNKSPWAVKRKSTLL